MDRSRWFGSARALAGVAADEAGWRALVTLADAAAAGCADAAELAEVFVPYLEQLAGRWPDHLRAASPRWIAALDARLSLARLLHLDSSTQLDALPGLLSYSPALRHLRVGAGVMHALPLLATLPPGHALDTLEIPLAGESRRVALDVVPALPGWTRGALVLAGAALPALRRLVIQRDDLTSEAAVGMAGAAWIKQLDHLDLSDNRVGPEGLLAIRAAVAPTCEVITRGCWGEGAMTGSAGSLVLRGVVASPPIIREILRVAAAQQTSRLHIEDTRLDDAMLGQIAGAALPALREVLVPGNQITPAGLAALAASPLIGQLTALDLSRNRGIADAPTPTHLVLSELLRPALRLTSLKLNKLPMPELPELPATLHTLELTDAWLRDRHLHQLAASALPLQHIDVSGNQHIGPDALEALASAAPGATIIAIGCWGDAVLKSDESMELRGAGEEAIEELARRSSGLHSVRRLELADLSGRDDPRLIEALGQIALPALEELVVRSGVLSVANVGAFVGLFKQARSLVLVGSHSGDTAGQAIHSALIDSAPGQAQSLTLSGVGLDAAALARLLPTLTGLRHLCLNNNQGLGDAGARALLGWPGFLQLESLQLCDCGLGPDALVMISAAVHAQGFEEPPDLGGNWGHDAIHAANTNGVLSISEYHIAALAAWPPLYELTRLTITAERLTDAALLPLADSPHLPPHLDLILDTEVVTNAPAALRALRRRGCVIDA